MKRSENAKHRRPGAMRSRAASAGSKLMAVLLAVTMSTMGYSPAIAATDGSPSSASADAGSASTAPTGDYELALDLLGSSSSNDVAVPNAVNIVSVSDVSAMADSAAIAGSGLQGSSSASSQAGQASGSSADSSSGSQDSQGMASAGSNAGAEGEAAGSAGVEGADGEASAGSSAATEDGEADETDTNAISEAGAEDSATAESGADADAAEAEENLTTLEATVANDGASYTVKVSYGDAALIPEDARLSVVEFVQEPSDSDWRYDPAYRDRPGETERFVSADYLGQRARVAAKGLGMPDDGYVFFAKFLSVAIEGEDGEVAPQAPVQVTVETNAVDVAAADAVGLAEIVYEEYVARDEQAAKDGRVASDGKTARSAHASNETFDKDEQSGRSAADDGMLRFTFSCGELGEWALVGMAVPKAVAWQDGAYQAQVLGAAPVGVYPHEARVDGMPEEQALLGAYTFETNPVREQGAMLWARVVSSAADQADDSAEAAGQAEAAEAAASGASQEQEQAEGVLQEQEAPGFSGYELQGGELASDRKALGGEGDVLSFKAEDGVVFSRDAQALGVALVAQEDDGGEDPAPSPDGSDLDGSDLDNADAEADSDADADTVTIKWVDSDGTVLWTDAGVRKGTVPEYGGATPTKPDTAQYTYAFADWTPAVTEAVDDATYTAFYTETVRTYTVTWRNYDNAVLATDVVEYGTVPAYAGATPTRPIDASHVYTFSGWSPEVAAVTGDATYTAQFGDVPIELHVQDVQAKGDLNIGGAVFTLTNNETGVEVWTGASDAGGIVPIPQVDEESHHGGGAKFEVGAIYTLKQTATDGGHFVPQGSWLVSKGDDGKYAITTQKAPGDYSTNDAEGPYGIGFYLYNERSAHVEYDYAYPDGVGASPDKVTTELDFLAYGGSYEVGSLDNGRDPLTDPDLSAYGYQFVGWLDSGNAAWKAGDVMTLDTVTVKDHGLRAAYRVPLKVSAKTYIGDDVDNAEPVSGAIGAAFAITVEQDAMYRDLEDFCEAFGSQNNAVNTLNAETDAYGFAFATLTRAAGDPAEPDGEGRRVAVRLSALRYDAGQHAWKYQAEPDSSTWVPLEMGDEVQLYYHSNAVAVKWVKEQGGSFVPLGDGFEDKVLPVSDDAWADSAHLFDRLGTSAAEAAIEKRSFFQYFGLGGNSASGPDDLRDEAGRGARLQDFSLKNSEGGLLFYPGDSSEAGSSSGTLLQGVNTLYMVYAETPPQGSARLAIANDTSFAYRMDGIAVGEGGADSPVAVLVPESGDLSFFDGAAVPKHVASTVAAGSTVHLVLIGAASSPFAIKGAFDGALEGDMVYTAVGDGSAVVYDLVAGAELSDTSPKAKGSLGDAFGDPEAETLVAFDQGEHASYALNKEWNDDAYPVHYEAAFKLYAVGKGGNDELPPAPTDEQAQSTLGMVEYLEGLKRTGYAVAESLNPASEDGSYAMTAGDDWRCVVPNLPKGQAYYAIERGVRHADTGADLSSRFKAAYEFDEDGASQTVGNTRVNAVCRVGAKEFRTIGDAVGYISEERMASATIEMVDDYIMAESGAVAIPSGFTITLVTAAEHDGAAAIVRGFDGGDMFAVESGAALEFAGVMLDGQLDGRVYENTSDGSGGGLVTVKAGGKVKLADGAVLQRGKAKLGGAVHVQAGGSLEVVEGAVLTGNEARGNGSALFVADGATATFTGGRVTRNVIPAGTVGAVAVGGKDARLVVSGDSYISDNWITDSEKVPRDIFLDQDSFEVIHVASPGLGEGAMVGVYAADGVFASRGRPAKAFATYDALLVDKASLSKLKNNRISGNANTARYGYASRIAVDGNPNVVVWGETFDFKVNVRWLDAEFRDLSQPPDWDAVTVSLLLDGNSSTTLGENTVQVRKDQGWTYTFQGLAKYAADGKLCTYTLEEAPGLPEGFSQITFAADLGSKGNPLSYDDTKPDSQEVNLYNYYKFIEFTIHQEVVGLEPGQTLKTGFALYSVPKHGMRGMYDLPAGLRATATAEPWRSAASQPDSAVLTASKTERFFPADGGSWYCQVDDAELTGSQVKQGLDANAKPGVLVRFNKFYDYARGDFSLGEGGFALAGDGSWQPGDVIRYQGVYYTLKTEAGATAPWVDGGDNADAWYELAFSGSTPTVAFDCKTQDGTVDGHFGADMLQYRLALEGATPTREAETHYIEVSGDEPSGSCVITGLDAGRYYYAVEISIEDTSVTPAKTYADQALIGAFDPAYTYNQDSRSISVKNTWSGKPSVGKQWMFDEDQVLTGYNIPDKTAAFEVYEVTGLSGELDDGKVAALASGALPDGASLAKVEGADFVLPDKTTGSWVHVFDDAEPGKTYAFKETRVSGSAVKAEDVAYRYVPAAMHTTVQNFNDRICMIVDRSDEEHSFRSLKEALEFGRDPSSDLDRDDAGRPAFTIQMLMDYAIPAVDMMEVREGEDITLCTASRAPLREGGNRYDGEGTRATISWGVVNTAPFATVRGNKSDIAATRFTLRNITLDGKATATLNNAQGGFVYAQNATLKLESEPDLESSRVEMLNRKASGGGGIYADNSDIFVNGSSFSALSATSNIGGGAIWSNGAKLDLADCEFASCVSAACPGGFFHNPTDTNNSSVVMNNCTFTDCVSNGTADKQATGAMQTRAKTLVMNGCTFVRCKSARQGGAMFHYPVKYGTTSVYPESYSKMTGCKFVDCQTTNNDASGGAFESDAYLVEIIGCTFERCEAKNNAGAINFWANNSENSPAKTRLFVRDSSFVDCKADSDANNRGLGGAICSRSLETEIENCAFRGAHGQQGGAVYCHNNHDGSTTTIRGCAFDDCKATSGSGGGVYSNSKVFSFETYYAQNEDGVQIPQRATFVDCTATGSGGGLYIAAVAPTIASIVFEDCSSTNEGGGIYHNPAGGSLLLEDCSFVRCKTTGDKKPAAAAYTKAKEFTVVGGDFTRCEATGSGGALHHNNNGEGSSMTVEGASFENCTSGDAGGAFYTNARSLAVRDRVQQGDGSDEPAVTHTSFGACESKGDGGAVRMDNSDASSGATFSDCGFRSCRTLDPSKSGGALYAKVKSLTVTGGRFESCAATGSGGGLYHTSDNAGASTAVRGASFESCRATSAISDGGAVWCGNDKDGTTAEVLGCTFRGCEAGRNGGALFDSHRKLNVGVLDGVLTIFERCIAAGDGGAVYQNNGNIASEATFTDCDFRSCETTGAAKAGGALYSKAKALAVKGGKLESCNATGSGGGVYHVNNATGASTTVEGVTFKLCRATSANSDGGALWSGGNNAGTETATTVNGCTFTSCDAGRSGGGVYSTYRGLAVGVLGEKPTSFSDCHARAVVIGGGGGGVYSNHTATDASVVLTRVTFDYCTAGGTGGGLHIVGGNNATSRTELNETRFTSCEALAGSGGGVFCSTGKLTIADEAAEGEAPTFKGCAAVTWGGGVYHNRDIEGGSCTLTGCTFEDCSVDVYQGGGIRVDARSASVTDTTFTRCKVVLGGQTGSGGAGGGAFSQGAGNNNVVEATIAGCKFFDCSVPSTGKGGAVYHRGTRLGVSDSDIDGCVAEGENPAKAITSAQYGGGIYSDRAEVGLVRVSVRNCTALVDGGGIYQNSTNNKPVVLDACTVSGNMAGNQGGGVYFKPGQNQALTLKNGTSVTGNRLATTTVENGAGVYLYQQNNGTATAVLVLGGDRNDDILTVADNTTSDGKQSNVRLNMMKNDNQGRVRNGEQSIRLNSNLLKADVGIEGSIGVCNPGSPSTQFGVSDIENRSGVGNIVSDDGSMHGLVNSGNPKVLIWHKPPKCKITDSQGNRLYYGASSLPAVFDSLSEAIRALNSEEFVGVPAQIQMLVDYYELESAMPVLQRDVTLTTARPGAGSDDDPSYPTNARWEHCVIARTGYVSGSMFTVDFDRSFTLAGIVVDGGSTGAGDLASSSNGGIILGRDRSSITLDSDSVLRNSRVSGNADGGAVHVGGAGSLTMLRNARIENCSARNGGGVYLVSTASLRMLDSVSIERCTALSAGGGVYASGFASVAVKGESLATPGISGNTVSSPSGLGAGVYLQNAGSRLYLEGSMAFGANTVDDPDFKGQTNGGEAYAIPRQDVYLADNGTGASQCIVLNGDVVVKDPSGAVGSIWVWAASSAHYEEDKQFAVVAEGVSVADSTLEVFRNARTDYDTGNDTGQYYTGSRGDVEAYVYWGNGEDVFFKKVDGYGNVLGGARFSMYRDYACTVPVDVRVGNARAAAVVSEGAFDATTGANVAFRASTGVYYMKEASAPLGFEDNPRVYRLVVGRSRLAALGIDAGGMKFAIQRMAGPDAAEAAPDIAAYGIMNVSTQQRKAIFQKVNEAGSPLAGAHFDILRWDRTPLATDVASGDDGLYWLGTLPYGTYYLHETVTPAGVTGNGDAGWWYTVRVDDAGVSISDQLSTEPLLP